jgi:hypothetical protein
MGFRLALSPTYEVEVQIAYPVDGGKVEKHKFLARFRRLPQPRLEAIRGLLAAGEMTDRDLLDEVLVALPGVQREDGSPLGDDRESLHEALDVHPMQPTLVRAFLNSLGSAREKN